MIPNTFFFFYKHQKYVFQQYFLNHSFHILLNNNFWTLWPNGPLITASNPSFLKNPHFLLPSRTWVANKSQKAFSCIGSFHSVLTSLLASFDFPLTIFATSEFYTQRFKKNYKDGLQLKIKSLRSSGSKKKIFWLHFPKERILFFFALCICSPTKGSVQTVVKDLTKIIKMGFNSRSDHWDLLAPKKRSSSSTFQKKELILWGPMVKPSHAF